MDKTIFIDNNEITLIDRIKSINSESPIKEINCYVGYASLFGILSLLDIFKESKINVKLNFYISEYISKKIDIHNNFNCLQTNKILDSIGYLIYKKLYYYIFNKNIQNIRLNKVVIKKYQHNHILDDFKYHGKVYEIITENKERTIIIGSSNLTCNGFGINEFNKNNLFPNEVNIETKNCAIIEKYNKWVKNFNEFFKFEEVNSLISQQKIYLHDFIQYCFDIKQTSENLDKNTKLNHFKNESKIWNDLKDYQKKTFLNIFKSLENYGGSILNYDVGLGKTHIGLAIFEYYYRFTGNIVKIITPKRLKSQWEEKLKHYDLDKFCHLVIPNSDKKMLETIKEASLLIIDEAHLYRNKNIKRRELLMKNFFINTKKIDNINDGEYKYDKKVLLITATPYNNSDDDLINLFELFGKPSTKMFHDDLDGIFENYKELIKKPKDEDGKIKDDFIKLISCCFNRLNKRQKRYNDNENSEYWFPKIKTLGKENVNKIVFDDEEFLSDIKNVNIELLNWKINEVLKKIQYIEKESLFSLNAKKLVSLNLMIALDSSYEAFKKTILKTYEKIFNNLKEYKKNPEYYTKKHKDSKNKHFNIVENDEYENNDVENDEYENNDEYSFELNDFDGKFYHTPEFLDSFNDYKIKKLKEIKEWVNEFEMYDNQSDGVLDIKFSYLSYILNKIYNENDENKRRKSIIFAQRINTIDYIYEQIKLKSSIIRENEVAIFVTGKYIKLLSGDKKIDFELDVSQPNHVNFIKKYFSPIANNELKTSYENHELNNYVPKILFTTNILSEGHDLQDATILINYDNHYNPTIIIQRIGRVDRFRDYKNNNSSYSYADNIYKNVYIYNFWLNNDLLKEIRMLQALETKSIKSDLLGSDTYKYYIEYKQANNYEEQQDEFSLNMQNKFSNTSEIFDALKAREYQTNHWNTLDKYDEHVISQSEDFICFPSKNNAILFLVKIDGKLHNIFVNHKYDVFIEDSGNEFFNLINETDEKSIFYNDYDSAVCNFNEYTSFVEEIMNKNIVSRKISEWNNKKKVEELKKVVFLIKRSKYGK